MSTSTQLRITIFGAGGNMGRRIAMEALARGHQVRAVGRSLTKLQMLPESIERCPADANDANEVARLARGQDLVINATRPARGHEGAVAATTLGLLRGTAQAGCSVLMVGGAAILKVPDKPGVTVLDDERYLPTAFRFVGEASQAQYDVCLQSGHSHWTYAAPPPDLSPGTRTGVYRRGIDELIFDDQGQAKISMEDFAVAILDEAESQRPRTPVFTVVAR